MREELSGPRHSKRSGGGPAYGGSGVGPQMQKAVRLTAIDRVLVEQKQREIASLQIEAKRAAVALWDVVGDRSPDLARL